MPLTPPSATRTIGGVGFYVDPKGLNQGVKPIIAQIQTINTVGTTLQYFGSPDKMVSLKGFVFSDSNHNTLYADAANGTTVAVTGDSAISGNYKILSFQSVKRNSLGWSDNWYECNLEMIKQ